LRQRVVAKVHFMNY